MAGLVPRSQRWRWLNGSAVVGPYNWPMQKHMSYAPLNTLLQGLGYEDDAAGYHGALCGALCVKRADEVDLIHLMDAGDDQPLPPDAGAQRELAKLREQALSSLQDGESGFTPLLPDDETDLDQRIAALVAWCEGFLFGLASNTQLDLKKCSEEAKEIVEDFAQFTRAGIGSDDDEELEETAYAELVEYIRVGAQLIYMELRPQPMPDPSTSKKIH
jgi:uncharacterized protein YgfB (UPF0149 family)